MKAPGNHFYIYLLNTVIVFLLAIALAVLITKSNMRDRKLTASCLFPRWCPPSLNVLWMSCL